MKYIQLTAKDYGLKILDEKKVAADPFTQFTQWFNEAINVNIPECNAMTLATVNAEGKPSARIVLLKTYDENGFIFFTNYHSRKSHELEENNQAILSFWWRELERQVRIEGIVEKIGSQESDAYFHERPRDSQVGAWVSPQSDIIPDRYYLIERQQRFSEQYADQEIPRPPHWGGFCLKPKLFEFWQGQASRLHDRITYRLDDENNWIIERLAP